MRYSKGHREETRARIVASASARFRRDGVGAVGVRTLIGDAGLTHGAFYSHFNSKADLLALAVSDAFSQTNAYWRDKVDGVECKGRLEAFIGSYLSLAHRGAVDMGCAGAALAPELTREGAEVREAFIRGIGKLTALIAELLPAGGDDEARLSRARSIFAGLMGTLQLSRLANDAEAGAMLAEGRMVAVDLGRQPWSAT